MLIVLAVISMVAAIALPGIVGLFDSGAEEQAYNHLAALLTAARAVAIRNSTYAGVHVQMSEVADMEDVCYAAIVWDDPATDNHQLSLVKGYEPRKIPGRVAFGEISGTFVEPSSGNYRLFSGQGSLDNFTTFSIIFSPSGAVVKEIDDNELTYMLPADEPAFREVAGAGTRLWDRPPNEPGVMAVVLFNYVELDAVRNDSTRVREYLNEHGQFLSVNIYTGQLFKRK